MKVSVNYTILVDRFYRRAINFYYGKPGLATRQEVKDWAKNYGSSMDDDISRDLADAIDRGDEPDGQ